LNTTPNSINYLLTTKGIPLSFLNTATVTALGYAEKYSVDNALTLMNSTLPMNSGARVVNPYYGRKTPFTRSNPDFMGIYLVTRLDGYDTTDIQSLSDQSYHSFKNPPSTVQGEQALINFNNNDLSSFSAVGLVQAWNYPLTSAGPSVFLMDQKNIMLGFNWGVNNYYAPIMSNTWNLGFAPGAIMDTAVSYGARTLNVEQIGGLVEVTSPTSSNQYVPQVKADIPKTDLLSVAKAGTLVYAGTGDNRNYGAPASAVRGEGIFVFDTVAGAWTATSYSMVNTQGALVGNYIYNLLYDSANNLIWASTENGVSSLDLGTQVWTPLDTGFGAHGVLINGSQLWVATDVSGVRVYDIPSRSYLLSYTHENSGLPTDYIWTIAKNPVDSSIIAGTYGSGLAFFDGTNWTQLSTGDPNGDYVHSMLVDGSTLWVGSVAGLWQVDLTSHAIVQVPSTGELSSIETLAVQGDSLLIGTSWNWIYQLSRSAGTLTQMDTSLFSSQMIHKIVVDGSNLWVGLGRSGQSLIADLITMGVTGVQGYVNEPGVDSVSTTAIRFETYLSGRNLAESFYAADQFLNWMGVVLGDPKAQPFQAYGMPNVNFSHLDDTFFDHTTRMLRTFPLEFRGRASTLAGQGTWTLTVSDGTVSANLATGTITASKIVDVPLSDPTPFQSLCFPSEMTITLESLDSTGAVAAEDSYTGVGYPVPNLQWISPEDNTIVSRSSALTITGSASVPYTIYYYAYSEPSDACLNDPNCHGVGPLDGFGTAGVTLANGGLLPVPQGGTLATIDLYQAVPIDPNGHPVFLNIYLVGANPACPGIGGASVRLAVTP